MVVSITIPTIHFIHHTTTVKVTITMEVEIVLEGLYQRITVLSISSIRVKS